VYPSAHAEVIEGEFVISDSKPKKTKIPEGMD
jgi:hypothetical protein